MSSLEFGSGGAGLNFQGFSSRRLISLSCAAAFLLLVISGIVLYLVPHGRIAYWTNWSLFGLSKNAWSDMHTVTALAFLVMTGLHIMLNWKSFKSYIIKGKYGIRAEFLVAVILAIILLLSAVYRIPPVSYALEGSQFLKDSWVKREYEPPFGRAELLSLESFCRKMEIPLEEAVSLFTMNGVTSPDPGQSLQNIAKSHGVSPLRLYMILKPIESKSLSKNEVWTAAKVETNFAGSGIGRKTFQEIANSLNLDSEDLITGLRSRNLQIEVGATLKRAADQNGLEPIELLKTILIKDYQFSRKNLIKSNER